MAPGEVRGPLRVPGLLENPPLVVHVDPRPHRRFGEDPRRRPHRHPRTTVARRIRRDLGPPVDRSQAVEITRVIETSAAGSGEHSMHGPGSVARCASGAGRGVEDVLHLPVLYGEQHLAGLIDLDVELRPFVAGGLGVWGGGVLSPPLLDPPPAGPALAPC